MENYRAMIKWPEGKSFAFTIFDDTDNSTVKNIEPVYDLLLKCNIKTTKSVWVYPPRDNFTGRCISEEDYLSFVKFLQKNSFEIALHSVGSGFFSRNEIIEGFEKFKQLLGSYPYIHVNHSRNPDSIYWGYKRFVPPLSWIYNLRQKQAFTGDDINSDSFWGDLSKKHIKYIRNRVFNEVNTGKYDTKMPYTEKSKSLCSNFWFSSSDGHTVEEFNNLITKKNLDKLEKENGFCIVYTHFASGFVDKNGVLNQDFYEKIVQLSKMNGWFVPVGVLLDFLISENGRGNELSYFDSLSLDMKWIVDRFIKKFKYGR